MDNELLDLRNKQRDIISHSPQVLPFFLTDRTVFLRVSSTVCSTMSVTSAAPASFLRPSVSHRNHSSSKVSFVPSPNRFCPCVFASLRSTVRSTAELVEDKKSVKKKSSRGELEFLREVTATGGHSRTFLNAKTEQGLSSSSTDFFLCLKFH